MLRYVRMILAVYLINKKGFLSQMSGISAGHFFYLRRVIKNDNAYYTCREETKKEEVYLGGEIQEL